MGERLIRCAAAKPCGSCPYRKDVPSGVWEREEYEKLPPYDGAMHEQPQGVFMCHQQDGRICAGWLGCHGADDLLSLRLAQAMGAIDPTEVTAILDYETDVPLHESGQAAHDFGVAEVEAPSPKAGAVMRKLERKRRSRDAA